MSPRRALAAISPFVMSIAVLSAAPHARAADVPLAADGQWNAFAVDSALAPSLAWIDDSGSPLSFSFTVAAGFVGTLSVVDAVFSGDTFTLTNFGHAFGATSAVPLTDFDDAHDAGLDYDAAWADASFSRGLFTLGAGSYRIGGFLAQSLLLDGAALDATAGALRLTLAPVPEPSTYALMLAGLGVAGLLAQRRLDA